jgi:ankyrin repeat protein
VFCRAAERGDPEIVRILLDHGADPCGFFDRDMALKECERFETPLSNPDEWPEGLPDGLRLPTVEEHASAPWSFEIPLACASKSGSVECVALLLARGADPSMRDNSGHTAMYGAGSEGVARLLMDHGVPIEDKDRLGWSPLVHAISDGADALPRIRGLIAAGANVNATHDRGFTVFMSAASTLLRDRRVIEALVEAGADPHAVTELGCNAFHAAVDASGEASWEPSVRSVLGYLHELGVDIELRNKVDITPLGGAVLEGNGIEVRVLVELGANPNADGARHECGESGCRLVRTPVLFAAIEAYQAGEKVEALVHGGARLDARNEHGQSPFDRARMALSEVQANKTLFRLADAERCVRILRGALAE